MGSRWPYTLQLRRKDRSGCLGDPPETRCWARRRLTRRIPHLVEGSGITGNSANGALHPSDCAREDALFLFRAADVLAVPLWGERAGGALGACERQLNLKRIVDSSGSLSLAALAVILVTSVLLLSRATHENTE